MDLQQIIDLDLDPLFRPPTRTGVVSAWWEHVPFAQLLITQVRPNTVVELGTHNGVSFSAFCEAMQWADVPGRCYAIDTWAGDPHAGFYGEEVHRKLRQFIDLRYKFCAELIRATFDEALSRFSDGSIDVLHIDGHHTYEAVKADFENWLPKISEKGIILFHDTNVKERDFGVYRLWEQLSKDYPSFEFLHGHGLGILAVGENQHEFVSSLCDLDAPKTRALRERLACIGARWSAVDRISQLEQHTSQLEQHKSQLEQHTANLTNENEARSRQISEYITHTTNLEHSVSLLKETQGTLQQQASNWEQDNKLHRDLLDVEREKNIRLEASLAAAKDAVLAERLENIQIIFGTELSLARRRAEIEENVALVESSELFDAEIYAGRDEAILHGISPALHYLQLGEPAGLSPSQRFDPANYAAINPDVAASGKGLLLHYLLYGRAEGRALQIPRPAEQDPEAVDVAMIEASNLFDPEAYAGRDEATAQGISPALHYLRSGELNGLKASDRFDPVAYAALNPDVAAVLGGKGLLLHYLRYGMAEGRPLAMAGSIELPPLARPERRETVIVAIHEATRTGAAILGWNIVVNLSKQYDIVVLLKKGGQIADAIRQAAKATVLLPDNFVPHVVECEVLVRRLISSYNPRYVIANSTETRFFVPSFEEHGVPTISLIHEFSTYTKPIGTLHSLFSSSAQVVFSAKLVAEDALTHYRILKAREYHIIPQGRSLLPADNETGPPTDRVSPAKLPPVSLQEEDGSILVVGLGTITPRKGVEFFISAAAAIARQRPQTPFRFVWVGSCYWFDELYLDSLLEQVKRSEASKIFSFVSETEDLKSIYEKAHLCFLSSRLDPLPNVAIDAASEGIPVVCFEGASGIAEMLKEAEELCDLVVPHLDAEAAARCLMATAEPERLARLSRAIRDWATRHFNMEEYVKSIDHLAQKTCAARDALANDARLILAADAFNAPFYVGRPVDGEHAADALTDYLTSSQRVAPRGRPDTGLLVRRPKEGFHPLVYASDNPDYDETKGEDPLAHFIRTGRPAGRWAPPIIRSVSLSSASTPNMRVCIHAHLHYPELFPELNALLGNNHDVDLILTTNSQEKADYLRRLVEELHVPRATILLVPNRGRDIGPMLTELRQTIIAYDLVGHVHAKRSLHVADHIGEKWRSFLWANLIGDNCTMMRAIITAFADDPQLGLVFPADPHLNDWDCNRSIADDLAAKIGLDMPLPNHFDFPQGTMFWARPEALAPLLDLGLGWDDYPQEPLPIDGTVLHAVERLIPFSAQQAGFHYAVTYVEGALR